MKKKLLILTAAVLGLLASCKPEEKDDEVKPDVTSTVFTPSVFVLGSGATADSINIVTIKDRSLGIGNYEMKKNTVYILDGFVYVNSGQTLKIEAGTIIKGKSGQGNAAAALVVAQGGKIEAIGTKDAPIIFTSEVDQTFRNKKGDLKGSNTLGKTSGLWGGLIILGKASLNTTPNVKAIEGIPTTESRGSYGGSDDADNSGTLKYVSIKHGGTNIGAGNEINGLTLGGVGSGTTLDYIEVYANDDDGIEFFGGTVSLKHAVVADCGDDGYDYDQGWRGKGQFWVGLNPADRAGEFDGGDDPTPTAQPYATPTIYNMTLIGGKKVTMRANAGGYINNSIFETFTDSKIFLEIEDLAAGDDSRKHYEEGRLKLENNIFASAATLKEIVYFGNATDELPLGTNKETLSVITRANPFPATVFTVPAPTDAFFDKVTYAGAFDGGANWAQGWTSAYPAAK